jgi:endo-1,4-beta-xylanase
MNVTRPATAGALTAAVLLTFSFPVAAAQGATFATAATDTTTTNIAPDTLRALAARADLRIGTAVDMSALANDSVYRQQTAAQFSTVTPENVMKWQLVEPVRGQFDWAAADQLVDFARANGQKIRGHTLVWHNQLPTWLTGGTFTAAELRQILRQHIFDEARHFKGRIWQWDVLNEAFNDDGTLRDTLWLRNLGPGYIADVFRWAHQADPGAKLFYNDYNIEGLNAKSNAVFALVTQLRKDGVPIDGVGVQGHFGVQYGFPADVADNLGRFAGLGLLTAVTEADVRMVMPPDNAKLQAQAQGYNVLLQGCLLTRHCISFTVWGYTDKYSWVPGFFTGQGAANLLDENFAAKPAFQAVRNTLRLAAEH